MTNNTFDPLVIDISSSGGIGKNVSSVEDVQSLVLHLYIYVKDQ